jgi:hypothetical protein
VVVGLSCPSHKAMTVISTPAWRSVIAAVCLTRRCLLGKITLADAQHRIATNWYQLGKDLNVIH